MSMWSPNGHQPRHAVIEGPTEAIDPAAVALAAGVTRLPQLRPAEPPPAPEPEPGDIRGGLAAALLPLAFGLLMGALAAAYMGVHTRAAYGWAIMIVMVGVVAAITAWGWGR